MPNPAVSLRLPHPTLQTVPSRATRRNCTKPGAASTPKTSPAFPMPECDLWTRPSPVPAFAQSPGECRSVTRWYPQENFVVDRATDYVRTPFLSFLGNSV
ncbi:hypothetical protein BDR03DRAFT_1011567 [Suillus americanus]|nr:hypothetical protein BDR03DRAFT_1011567 [Suillus americanus]